MILVKLSKIIFLFKTSSKELHLKYFKISFVSPSKNKTSGDGFIAYFIFSWDKDINSSSNNISRGLPIILSVLEFDKFPLIIITNFELFICPIGKATLSLFKYTIEKNLKIFSI